MPYPIILVSSGTGSDSAASGAGPATALTGTNASTDSAGLVVTLDGSPDLTGVTTDGTHVLYLADATTGARNFAKITNKANSGSPTAQVTVELAFGLSLTAKSWAIGGKRASIGGSVSLKLITNNASFGDAQQGWIIEMQSAHAETAPQIVIRVTGNVTGGPFVIRGAPGAAVRPSLTFTNNGDAFNVATGFRSVRFADFDIQNTNATKTASVGINFNNAATNMGVASGIRIAHATNKFWKGITSLANVTIEFCEIGYCANIGTSSTSAATAWRYNKIHDCGSHGISCTTAVSGSIIEGNEIYANAGDGINDARNPTTLTNQGSYIRGNTIHGNTGDGIEFTCTNTQTSILGGVIENNNITANGGYGTNFSGSGFTDNLVNYLMLTVRGNNTGTGALANTAGSFFPTTLTFITDDPHVDPGYLDAASGDFSVGAAVAAKGFPVAGLDPIGTFGGYSYVDIGSRQRQEPAAGGSFTITRRGGTLMKM